MARRQGIEGIVYVSGTVTKHGQLINERIEQGLGYGLDEESIRVVQMLPDDWLPVGWGKQSLDSKVVLQIMYKLN
jgi:hypothetical protein